MTDAEAPEISGFTAVLNLPRSKRMEKRAEEESATQDTSLVLQRPLLIRIMKNYAILIGDIDPFCPLEQLFLEHLCPGHCTSCYMV